MDGKDEEMDLSSSDEDNPDSENIKLDDGDLSFNVRAFCFE